MSSQLPTPLCHLSYPTSPSLIIHSVIHQFGGVDDVLSFSPSIGTFILQETSSPTIHLREDADLDSSFIYIPLDTTTLVVREV